MRHYIAKYGRDHDAFPGTKTAKLQSRQSRVISAHVTCPKRHVKVNIKISNAYDFSKKSNKK